MRLPWTVDPEKIAELDARGLRELMDRLVKAQAYRAGADPSQVRFASNLTAADGGEDGWSPAPTDSDDPWLKGPTCWQTKAGTQGQPGKLKGEIRKQVPQETLAAGGYFVVVASAAVSASVKDGLAKLQAEADLPHKDRIRVLGQDELANWLEAHPALAMRFRGLPGDVWTFERWDHEPTHREPWHTRADQAPSDLAAKLPFGSTGCPTHVHIWGRPGVGKTRLALEIARQAPWKGHVIYISGLEERTPEAWIDGLNKPDAQGAHLVLVVDECAADRAKRLHDRARVVAPRALVITIGHDRMEAEADRVVVELAPLADRDMEAFLGATVIGLPSERIAWLVQAAEGYVRLGLLMAKALVQNPDLVTSQILQNADVRDLLIRMFPEQERRVLNVVAALDRVGWEGEVEDEGRTIAEHLGLNWMDTQTRIGDLARRHVVQKAGRYRYISPDALARFLYLLALEDHPRQMQELRAKLSPAAQEGYVRRLRSAMTHPWGKEVAKEELERFFTDPDDLTRPEITRRWALLSVADPALAASRAREALQAAPHELKLAIRTSRRDLVNGLKYLAHWAEAFEDAALGLAELALAENETWANNASHTFAVLFHLGLSQSALPWRDRLLVIDVLIDEPRTRTLGLLAAAQVVSLEGWDISDRPGPEGPPPARWEFRTAVEQDEYFAGALERVGRAARLLEPETLAWLPKRLVDAFRPFRPRNGLPDGGWPIPSWELTERVLREVVNELPVLGPTAEGAIRDVARWWARADHTDKDRRDWIAALAHRWDSETLDERFRRLTGKGMEAWDDNVRWDDLVRAHLQSDADLARHWVWLTSGEALHTWEIGKALAHQLGWAGRLEHLLDLPGRGSDLRLLCGYLEGELKSQSEAVRDDRLDQLLRERPQEAQFIAEATWRLHPSTSRGVERMTALFGSGQIPITFATNLVFGGWISGPERRSLEPFFERLTTEPSMHPVVVKLLCHRIASTTLSAELRQAETNNWRPLLRQVLASTAPFARTHPHFEHDWARAAETLLPDDAALVAGWLLDQDWEANNTAWLEYSSLAGPLLSAAKANGSAVWAVLAPLLASEHSFSAVLKLRALRAQVAVGADAVLPGGLLKHIPDADLLAWADDDPENRSGVLIQLTAPDWSNDSRWMLLLRRYAKVNHALNSAGVAWQSGSWTGPMSSFLASRLLPLEQLAARKEEPRHLRDWAEKLVRSLRKELEAQRQQEEEEALLYR